MFDHVDAHRRLALPCRDQPPLDRRRADTGQDIPAALRVRDPRLLHEDLQEQVIHVRIRPARRGQQPRPSRSADRPPRSRRSGAVGAAHDPHKKRVTRACIARQIAREENTPPSTCPPASRGRECPRSSPAPRLHGVCTGCVRGVTTHTAAPSPPAARAFVDVEPQLARSQPRPLALFRGPCVFSAFSSTSPASATGTTQTPSSSARSRRRG